VGEFADQRTHKLSGGQTQRTRFAMALVWDPDGGVGGGAGVTIRLLLADDQELIRTALAALLELEDDFEVVAQVGRGDQVVAAARRHQPDIALLDIEMPGLDGLAAATDLAAEQPGCKVVMLTTFGRPGYLRRAMEAGAQGFVVKDAPAEELAAAIRRVAAGERVVDPELATLTLRRAVAAHRPRA
jgi:two-component system response regulator DesR